MVSSCDSGFQSSVNNGQREAVHRLEPRLAWEDISMRISPGPNGEMIRANAVNQRLLRFRDSWCLLSWHHGRISDPKTRASVANRLSDQQITSNTTLGTTPSLVDPSTMCLTAWTRHPSRRYVSITGIGLPSIFSS